MALTYLGSGQYYCHNLLNSDYEYLRNLDTCLFNKLINFEFLKKFQQITSIYEGRLSIN